MLQAYGHPAEGINKSKNIKSLSHDGLKILTTSTLLDIGPKDYQRGSRVTGVFPFPVKFFE